MANRTVIQAVYRLERLVKAKAKIDLALELIQQAVPQIDGNNPETQEDYILLQLGVLRIGAIAGTKIEDLEKFIRETEV